MPCFRGTHLRYLQPIANTGGHVKHSIGGRFPSRQVAGVQLHRGPVVDGLVGCAVKHSGPEAGQERPVLVAGGEDNQERIDHVLVQGQVGGNNATREPIAQDSRHHIVMVQLSAERLEEPQEAIGDCSSRCKTGPVLEV